MCGLHNIIIMPKSDLFDLIFIGKIKKTKIEYNVLSHIIKFIVNLFKILTITNICENLH